MSVAEAKHGLGEAIARLDQLREFAGPELAFWTQLLAAMGGVAGARLGVLLREGPTEEPGWKTELHWPRQYADDALLRAFATLAGDLAESCVQHGEARRGVRSAQGVDWCVAVRVMHDGEPGALVLAFLLPGVTEDVAVEAVTRLRLLTSLPTLYQLRRQVADSETAVSHFAAVLDLVSALNVQQRFLAVAMTFCNEIATRHRCDRVSLGWLEGGYAKVVAISRSEKFERKMEAIRQLEAVMEEAIDQDEIVLWPAPGEQQLVTRAHEQFSTTSNVPSLCSVPLRLEGEPVAVLVGERVTQPFTEVEVRLFALYGEMSARRLADLKRTDRWFGARWLAAGRERLAGLLGPKHTLAKFAGLGAVVLLILSAVVKIDYRVEAPFSLRTEDLSFIGAPFNGYLDEVKVDVGDEVKKGAVLASLDVRDLLLEEAGAAAEQTRLLGEVEKASAADKPAEMQIARAQAEQARVRLELIQLRRSQAEIVAPFDGVVVEGDLKKRIGAAVKQGDVLLRLARTDRMYVECSVNERDIRELRAGFAGEIAFASAPKHSRAVRITRIEPAAQVKEAGNIFAVRCGVDGTAESWWRPGMSGVAKLEIGRRTILWALTHRTVDFLRMQLWW